MSSRRPRIPSSRPLRVFVVVTVALAAALLVAVPVWLSSSPPSVAAQPAVAQGVQSLPGALPPLEGAGGDAGSVSAADGGVAAGTTVFDGAVPAVGRLDPALLEALRRAAVDAADRGVILAVNSGWRSRGYQDRLLADAIAEYGSAEEAARWVATPDTSPHVQGAAIDIGGTDAAAWLAAHGAAYGLCQIYANEPWHYELRPDARATGCPAMYPDPTHDPRMHS